MFERILSMVIKEFILAFRDKRTVFFILVPPLVQLFLFGYVATMDVNNVSVGLLDLDNTVESRELGRRITSSGYFTVKYSPESPEEIKYLIDRGKVLCAIQINHGFAKDIRKGIPTEVQVIMDGTDSNTALIALSYLNKLIAGYTMDFTPASIRAALFQIDFRTRVWYNPDLKSRNYFVPGVIASIVMLTCLILTSMAVVRERETGTIEQLMVSPIKPAELILGKTVHVAFIGFFDMALVTAVSVLWFNVPVRGSILLLVLSTAVYILSVLGIGLFISTISRTQQQAMMASFFFFMPAILLSGFTFPIENMPMVFQYVTYLSPLRYFLVIIRGIFLKGTGIGVLWEQIAALLILGLIILSFSSLRFRKRLA